MVLLVTQSLRLNQRLIQWLKLTQKLADPEADPQLLLSAGSLPLLHSAPAATLLQSYPAAYYPGSPLLHSAPVLSAGPTLLSAPAVVAAPHATLLTHAAPALLSAPVAAAVPVSPIVKTGFAHTYQYTIPAARQVVELQPRIDVVNPAIVNVHHAAPVLTSAAIASPLLHAAPVHAVHAVHALPAATHIIA